MGNLLVTDEMLKIKSDIELVNTDLETMFTDINTNLDSIVLNWTGNKAKIVLEQVDAIKKKNTDLLLKMKAKSEEIGKAYEVYMKNSQTEIIQSNGLVADQNASQGATQGPLYTSNQVVNKPTEENPTQTAIPVINPIPSTNPIIKDSEVINLDRNTIIPNISELKFNYDDNGNIKRYGKTDFYPVNSSSGMRYLLYLGGRAPTDPIPSNSQILLGLHGSGERATGSGSELNKLFNNGIPKYFADINNKKDVIAIVPQIADGNLYSDNTVDALHNIYNDVKSAYSAKPGIDLSGISMGGQISIKYIAKYPEDIETATIMSGGPPINSSQFSFNEQEINNIRSSDVLFISGKNDWKNDQYKRASNFYQLLTGNNTPDFRVTTDDSLYEITKTHKQNGGINFVEVENGGHNTWSAGIPAIINKYN